MLRYRPEVLDRVAERFGGGFVVVGASGGRHGHASGPSWVQRPPMHDNSWPAAPHTQSPGRPSHESPLPAWQAGKVSPQQSTHAPAHMTHVPCDDGGTHSVEPSAVMTSPDGAGDTFAPHAARARTATRASFMPPR
jgi:hypothetical protein